MTYFKWKNLSCDPNPLLLVSNKFNVGTRHQFNSYIYVQESRQVPWLVVLWHELLCLRGSKSLTFEPSSTHFD